MTAESLNDTHMAGNTCFGCGHANALGLQATFRRDPGGADRILGTLEVPEHFSGLPGISHGGVLYTAMDCLAAWVKFILRPDDGLMPIGRTTTITYHRPARVGHAVELVGTVAKESSGPGDPMVVRAEARSADGTLLSEGAFTLVLLPVEQFKKVAGIASLPPELAAHFERAPRGTPNGL